MNLKGLEPPPDNFLSPLLELRDYYSHLVEEYERLFLHARSQLEHVEALLSTWSFTKSNQQLSELDVPNESLSSADETSLLLLSADKAGETDSEECMESEILDSDEIEVDNSTSVTSVTVDSEEPQLNTTFIESSDNSIRGPEVSMLPHYEALTRMEAIRKLLQEHMGTVCHIDFIVRSLYGELESHLFKVVKGRVQSSLTQGREKSYWAAIPDEPGCYTLDLGLVTPTTRNSASVSVRPKRKKPFILPRNKVVPMLRAFEGQFLIDAITSFLEQNPEKIFSVAEIVNGIYGELDSQQLREVKNKVLNELSRGHRTGRFFRVPDKIGFYTWDLSTTTLRRSSR